MKEFKLAKGCNSRADKSPVFFKKGQRGTVGPARKEFRIER